MTKYYLANDNQRLGPFDVNELLQNGLVPDSLVWCKGMAGWEKAKDVPELATLMSSTSSAVIPPQLPNQSVVYQQPNSQQPSIPQQPYSQQYPNSQQYGQYPQPYYNRSNASIVQEKPQNKYGLLGFVFSICTILIGLIPIVNLISPFTWLAGLILSIMGLSSKPNGLAIAGLIISLGGIVIAILIGFMFGFLFML